ncbi:MAG TPA: hypothetical protein VM287_15200 [Egibacteraceae bacterium]|nr:hypothetical protein [Egibacteraceae bacterium]
MSAPSRSARPMARGRVWRCGTAGRTVDLGNPSDRHRIRRRRMARRLLIAVLVVLVAIALGLAVAVII